MPPCSVIQILSWLFKSGSFSEWMDVVKVVGAAIAFGIGLWQYRSSQVWKRLEFVSAQMKIFFDDPAVRTTMQMLDWRKKKIPLFKFRDEADGEQATVDYKMVASALGTDPETRTTLLNVTLDGAASVLLSSNNKRIGFSIPSPDGRFLAIWETSGTSNVWLVDNSGSNAQN